MLLTSILSKYLVMQKNFLSELFGISKKFFQCLKISNKLSLLLRELKRFDLEVF